MKVSFGTKIEPKGTKIQVQTMTVHSFGHHPTTTIALSCLKGEIMWSSHLQKNEAKKTQASNMK